MSGKIAYLAPVSDFVGGAEKVLFQMLDNKEIEPVLIVPADGALAAAARAKNIMVHIVSFGAVNDIHRPLKIKTVLNAIRDAMRAAWQIIQIARAEKVLCVHSNGLKAHGIAVLGRLMGGGKLICHIHDVPATMPEKIFWKLLQMLATKILLVSRHCWYEDQIPANAVIVPNGMEILNPSLPVHALSSPSALGFIGRIHPHKGLHVLIEWLAQAKKHGLAFHLSIRGEAAPEQMTYLEDIKTAIRQNDLTFECEFKGKVNGYENVYSGLDIVVMPSVTNEPFGLVAIESFERGIPCIAYPSGALPDIIDDGKTGFLAKDAAQFIEALSILTQDKAEYEQIRAEAFQDVCGKYSLTSFYQKLNDLYRSL